MLVRIKEKLAFLLVLMTPITPAKSSHKQSRGMP